MSLVVLVSVTVIASALQLAASSSSCSFSSALGSNMVLQRDVHARIWGTAKPGSNVVATVISTSTSSTSYNTTASSAGDWQIDLTPQSSTTTPTTIKLQCDGAATSTSLNNVLFGDVFGCHGQSNMQFGLEQDINAAEECKDSINYPLIRFATFTQHQQWSVAGPATVCTGKSFQPLSAVCWYFGKGVHKRLNMSVPIGLMSSNVGGTAVEKWSH